MKHLLKKEFKMAMHPTAPMFLMLSTMLLIPNYPYYVVFFYTSLAIFFICLSGRENHDIFYTMLLPVRKSHVVKARFLMVILLELAQVAIAVPFALLRQRMPVGPNVVGMDANGALFGVAFIMLGIFNIIFFGIYYKNTQKVGKAFAIASIVVFLYICIAEALAHVVPFIKNYLDTTDAKYQPYRFGMLLVGFVVYALLTNLAYKRAQIHFEQQDL